MFDESLKDRLKTHEGIDALTKEDYPDFAHEIKFENKDRQFEYYYLTKSSPWNYGRVSLIGDSSFAVGPVMGIGLNLLMTHIRGICDAVKRRGIEDLWAITNE